MEFGEVSDEEKEQINSRLGAASRDMGDVLNEASEVLSGLTGGASLVSSPTSDDPIRQVDFVPIGRSRALCILVADGGDVEKGHDDDEQTDGTRPLVVSFCELAIDFEIFSGLKIWASTKIVSSGLKVIIVPLDFLVCPIFKTKS